MDNFIIHTSDEQIHARLYYDSSDVFLSDKKNHPVAVISHGLAGYKEEAMLQVVKECFIKRHIPVLMYDARHSLGESGGRLEQACFSEFISDLNTVINWLHSNGYNNNSLFLVGHSLGAGAGLHYASMYPNEVTGIITLSGVYNGQLLKESYLKNRPDFMAEWQKTGLIYREHPHNSDKNGYISIQHLDDACQYAVEKNVNHITCPVLIICGDHDVSSTIEINKKLHDSFTGNAQLEVIDNCGHTYSKEQNQIDLKNTVLNWLDNKFSK